MAWLDVSHCRRNTPGLSLKRFIGKCAQPWLSPNSSPGSRRATIGFSQWIVLRRYVTASSNWTLADGTSWAAGYVLGLLLIQTLPSAIFVEFIGYLLFGVIVALVQ